MRRIARNIWALLVVLVWAASALSQTAGIGWPEAVGRLAEERSRAQLCVASIKKHGNQQQIAQGELVYGTAKANFDGVIVGLVIALAEGGNPGSLSSLDARLTDGATGLGQFCKSVSDLVPNVSGEKDVLAEAIKAAIEPAINALSEGVAALYNNHRKDDALTRQTIQTQLEAAKWPDFGEVKVVQ
jgi:hypothetical protein